MKWLLIAVAGLIGLAALTALIGALLPQSHVAVVEKRYEVPPESVWVAITQLENFPDWRSDVDSVRILTPVAGRPRWIEKSGSDSLTFEVVEQVRPNRLVTRIADEGLPFGGTWTYELEPVGAGTNLVITEQGEVYNPIFRFVSRFVMGHTATLEKYHAGLATRWGGQRP